LRSVGGPYVDLFSQHLGGLFQHTFDVVDERDKSRLDFMLSTWERRGALRAGVLDAMRRSVGALRVTLDAYPQMQGVGPVRKFGEPKVKAERPVAPSGAHPHVHSGGMGGFQNSHGATTGSEVKGFVAETLVSVSVDRAREVQTALRRHIAEFDLAGLEASSGSCKKALARLSSLLTDVQVPPPVPQMIFGLLPVEPSKEFKALAAVQHISVAKPAGGGSQAKIPMPKFRTDQLERDSGMKESALQALVGARPFVSRQDGQRFRTEVKLAEHLDLLYARNRERTRVEDMGERVFRPPFCQVSQWVTDFNKLQVQTGAEAEEAAVARQTSLDGLQADEERVLLADDFFPRCPVSKEVFEHIWDDEDGDIYYRNAVKVLLSEGADPQLFKNSRPTARPAVRYCIVHKTLVLDGWLEAGRATVLRNAVERYQAVGKGDLASELLAAGGADSDGGVDSDGGAEQDFVLLELAWHRHNYYG